MLLQQNIHHLNKDTRFTFHNHNEESDVDHVFSSKTIKTSEVTTNPILTNSHHLAIKFSFDLETKNKHQSKRTNNARKAWNLHKLKTMNTQSKQELIEE
jgi:hypothetical protein